MALTQLDLWSLSLRLGGIVLALYCLSILVKVVQNLFFHPLRHIPGPKFAAAGRLYYAYSILTGTITQNLVRLHQQYGEVVRIAPDEVSFISGETAWQDIYGFHPKSRNVGHFLKNKMWYQPTVNGVRPIVGADPEAHSRMRRALSHAFSEKAIKEQQPLLMDYIELMCSKLRDKARRGSQLIDMVELYNWTTFDIIGDLTFGQSLDCLQSESENKLVSLVFGSIRAFTSLVPTKYIPALKFILPFVISKETMAAAQERKMFFRQVEELTDDRLARKTDRPDFYTHITRNRGTEELTRPEMHANSLVLLIAGSETTATMLSGTTYMLLRTPEVLKKLVSEIRSAFKSVEDITLSTVTDLKYLDAVINEGLRYYPPVPTGFPRTVPDTGAHISGYYIPPGSVVYMSQFPANHSERNFKDPEIFAPERWLGDARYETDKLAVVKPFAIGPRNCLGQSLAWAEMRLILARVLFEFDLELEDPSQDWLDQKTFTLWAKPPLRVKVASA